MVARLDPSSPIPLYHQLAEAVRAEIAAGTLEPGDRLPPLRVAADAWGVNLHTVRHAYRALAEAGLVRTTAPRGTVVLRPADVPPPVAMPGEDIITRFLRDAREQYGLSLHDLRRQLERQVRGEPELVEAQEIVVARPTPDPRATPAIVYVI